MMPPLTLLKNKSTRTKLVLGLGAVAVIFVVIQSWISISSAMTSHRKIKAALAEITAVSQGVQKLYAEKKTMDNLADGTQQTTQLIAAKIFPYERVSGAYAPTPWGTATNCNALNFMNCVIVTTQSQTKPDTADAFAIEFMNIPAASCVSLLLDVHDPSLIYANATPSTQGVNLSLIKNKNLLTGTPPTLTSKAAHEACKETKTVNVQFGFKLRPTAP